MNTQKGSTQITGRTDALQLLNRLSQQEQTLYSSLTPNNNNELKQKPNLVNTVLTPNSPVEAFEQIIRGFKHPAHILEIVPNANTNNPNNDIIDNVCSEILSTLTDFETSLEDIHNWKTNFLKQKNVPSNLKLNISLLFSKLFRSQSDLREPVFALMNLTKWFAKPMGDKRGALLELEKDFKRQSQVLDVAVRKIEHLTLQVSQVKTEVVVKRWERVVGRLMEVKFGGRFERGVFGRLRNLREVGMDGGNDNGDNSKLGKEKEDAEVGNENDNAEEDNEDEEVEEAGGDGKPKIIHVDHELDTKISDEDREKLDATVKELRNEDPESVKSKNTTDMVNETLKTNETKNNFSLMEVMELTLIHAQQLQLLQKTYESQIVELQTKLANAQAEAQETITNLRTGLDEEQERSRKLAKALKEYEIKERNNEKGMDEAYEAGKRDGLALAASMNPTAPAPKKVGVSKSTKKAAPKKKETTKPKPKAETKDVSITGKELENKDTEKRVKIPVAKPSAPVPASVKKEVVKEEKPKEVDTKPKLTFLERMQKYMDERIKHHQVMQKRVSMNEMAETEMKLAQMHLLTLDADDEQVIQDGKWAAEFMPLPTVALNKRHKDLLSKGVKLPWGGKFKHNKSGKDAHNVNILNLFEIANKLNPIHEDEIEEYEGNVVPDEVVQKAVFQVPRSMSPEEVEEEGYQEDGEEEEEEKIEEGHEEVNGEQVQPGVGETEQEASQEEVSEPAQPIEMEEEVPNEVVNAEAATEVTPL